MSTQKMYRQGDVGLIPVDGPPANQKRKAEKRKLIRKGEHGGVHQLESLDHATIYSVLDEAEKVVARYIEVTEPTRVVHGEHNSITLPPGWYEIRIQREQFQTQRFFTGD